MLSALSLPPSVSNTHFQEKTSAPCTADHHLTQHTSSPRLAQSSHCLLPPITPVKQLNSWPPHGFFTTHMTEWLHFHFSLWLIGEGNGNPLQCSCLENPRDGGAWWAAVYGVAQSRTQLKRCSSNSSKCNESTRSLLCHVRTQWVRSLCLEGPHRAEPDHTGTLILNFSPLTLREKASVIFKPTSPVFCYSSLTD